jgi:SpoVK/Ycf46/Vps4 family AAA+-type ATPase
MIALTEEVLAASRGSAAVLCQRLGVKNESRKPLETFLAVYDAVHTVTKHHDAALYIAASEARPLINAAPARKRFKYPEAPGELLEGIDPAPNVLAAYFSYLIQAAEQPGSGAPAVNVLDKVYALQRPARTEQLVGLEKEEERLLKYVKQLFLYNQDSLSNPDSGCFPRTIMLTGSPGTGKTSLFKKCLAEAKRLAQLTSKKLTIEIYDASNFSSYFGKSTRILKQKLARVQNPGGIGLFCIEDVDMVLQSREDSHAYHGVLQVQQYLMNYLSGLEPWYGNTLTFLSTNRPQALDAALASRIQCVLHVNPFSVLGTHRDYLRMHFPELDTEKQMRLASSTYAAGFTGRDLEAILYLSKESVTRAPTDEELLGKSNGDRRRTVNYELLEKLIAARTVALHS